MTILCSNSAFAFPDYCAEYFQNPTLAFTTPQEATGYGRYAWSDPPQNIPEYYVDTLSDYDPALYVPNTTDEVPTNLHGSLRYIIEHEIGCFDEPNPAACIVDPAQYGSGRIKFDVSGEINLVAQLDLRGNYVWMDGRDTPENPNFPQGGITITGHQFSIKDSRHIVIRFMRFRSGVNTGSNYHCARSLTIIGGQYGTTANVIIDHCSIGASQDDNLTISEKVCHVTVQYCIIGGGVYKDAKAGIGSSGTNSVETDEGITVCHNLITNTFERQLHFGGRERVDFYNNVVGNSKWATQVTSCVPEQGPRVNILYNWYRTGKEPASTQISPYFYDPIRASQAYTTPQVACSALYVPGNHEKIHIDGNRFERYVYGGQGDVWTKPYEGGDQWDLTVAVAGSPLTPNWDAAVERDDAWNMWPSDDYLNLNVIPNYDTLMTAIYNDVMGNAGCRIPGAQLELDTCPNEEFPYCDQELHDQVDGGARYYPTTDAYDLKPGQPQAVVPTPGSQIVSHTLDELKWDSDETQFQKVFFKHGTLIDQVPYEDISDGIYENSGHYYASIPESFLPLQEGENYCWRIEAWNGCVNDPTYGLYRVTVLTFCVECNQSEQ